MNPHKEKNLARPEQYSAFWICLVVFLLLACDYGWRLTNQMEQRQRLEETRLQQAQNMGVLTEAQQIETRIQSLSLDLLEVARTNAAAGKVVQDFNIQWNPGPTPAPVAPPAAAAATPTNSPPTTSTNRSK